MTENLNTLFSTLSFGQSPRAPGRANLSQYKANLRASAKDDDTSSKSAGVSPWGIALAAWDNTQTNAISNFEASWQVPPAPTDKGETYNIYNGLVWTVKDDGGNDITANIRLLLQWAKPKAGGAAGWSITTWYLGQNSSCSTSPVSVTAGASITGKITLTAQSSTEYDYKCVFTDSNGEIDGTQMYIYGGNAYTSTFLGFEWYGVTDKSLFPSTAVVASNIVIQTGSSTPATISWTTQESPNTQNYTDQVTVKVDDNSSSSGKVEFDLPKPS